MCPEKRTYLADRKGNSLLGLLPRVDAHFGLWREHRALHGDGVRVRRDVIRQDQYRRLAMAHEIARHSEDEVGIGAVHPGQELFDHLHCDVRPTLDQFRTPAGLAAVVHDGWHLRPKTNGLRRYSCDNTIGRPLQEVPKELTLLATNFFTLGELMATDENESAQILFRLL